MRDYLYRVVTDQQNGFFAKFIKGLLLLLSWAYCGVLAARGFFYRTGVLQVVKLEKPVISVGNITWGGVGKTPFVILVAEYLRNRRAKAGVLLRGYMKKSSGQSGQSDEAMMLREYFPDISVGVGSDRRQASRQLLADNSVDMFILDDGFQHQQVHRDLDIVLVDTVNPFGNGQLIPRGILREPLGALKRAQIIILTKSDFDPSATQILQERLKHLNRSCVFAWAVHAPEALVELFSQRQEAMTYLQGSSGCKIVSFCGIGDPRSFQESLAAIGAKVTKNFVFPDHHVYSAQDIEMILAQAQKLGVEDFVTTAKDAVKLLQFKQSFGSRRCWILKIAVELTKGKDEVFERIDQLLGR